MSELASFGAAENQAKRAESAIASKQTSNGQLEATIDAVELYMKALRLVEDPRDRKRLDAKCKTLLSRAENLKGAHDEISLIHSPISPFKVVREDLRYPVSERELTRREKIIILEGSKLNGFMFRPWQNAPDPAEFDLRPGESQYEDAPRLPLSDEQMEHFDGWRRPTDALRHVSIEKNGSLLSNEPTMNAIGAVDLVQDLTSDCSVVASLCAGVSRAARGHRKILGAIVHPYNYEDDQVVISQSGKYVLRFWFNGCWRKIDIDDLLPTSKSERVLHVVDRNHPGLLWPALVEKAYLKIRGGYDFPGSNSGTDLAVLTGWIPQQIFLHDDDVDPEILWERIYESFNNGDVLLTMGTGKLTDHEQDLFGLAALHDFSVLEVREADSTKELLVKNPWADGDVWKGARRRRSNHPIEESSESNGSDQTLSSDEDVLMSPGTFWMDFRSVFQYFDNLYVNWNPGLFDVRNDVHFTWDLVSADTASNLFVDNPQFFIKSSHNCEVWLLLNRHFRTGDYTKAAKDGHGHISLYIYDRKGKRILSTEGPKVRGPYVDSPNTLLICHIPKDSCYTVVVSVNGLKPEKYNFTLSTFSRTAITLEEAHKRHAFEATVASAWTRSTAGGNSDCGSYLTNPQFSLKLVQTLDAAFILRLNGATEDQKKNTFVKILILASDGKRVTRLRARDVVAHSGDYRRGGTVIEQEMSAGNYTIICSTFDAGQCANFRLTMQASATPESGPSLLAPEGSGRLNIFSQPAGFPQETTCLLAPIMLTRTTKAILIARTAHNSPSTARNAQSKPSSALFRMTLEQGQGPYRKLLSSSTVAETDFNSLENGVRIEDISLSPQLHASDTGGLWLVLERSGPTATDATETDVVQVEILSEERLEIGPWGYRQG